MTEPKAAFAPTTLADLGAADSTAEDSLYPMVTHALNFVGRRALGLVQAGNGDRTN